MQKVIWSSEAVHSTSGDLPPEYVWGEVLELWEEVKRLDWVEIGKEWDDVIACTSVCLFVRTGISIPLLKGFGIGAVQRWRHRFDVWKKICEAHDIEFHKGLLVNGGNYKKKKKWVLALKEAGYQGEINYDLELVDWEWEV